MLATCKAPERPWDASKSGNFFYGCLVVTLLVCVIPLSITFAAPRSITSCGPHRLYATGMQAVFGYYVSYAPAALSLALYWLFNPIVLVGIVFVLSIAIYFVRGTLREYDERLTDAQKELVYEQKEKARVMVKLRQIKMYIFFALASLFLCLLSRPQSQVQGARRSSWPSGTRSRYHPARLAYGVPHARVAAHYPRRRAVARGQPRHDPGRCGLRQCRCIAAYDSLGSVHGRCDGCGPAHQHRRRRSGQRIVYQCAGCNDGGVCGESLGAQSAVCLSGIAHCVH